MNGSAKINILENLNTVVTIGEVSSSGRRYFFTPSTLTTVINGSKRNSGEQKLEESDQKSFEWIGNYYLDLNKHSFKLLGGYSF
ncbi:hypothetical protein D3C86_2085090 [compost metagenome]